MQAPTTKLDLRVLGIAGTLLFILAAVFLWRDLEVPPAVLAAVAAVGVAGLSMSGVDRRLPLLAPIAMVALVMGVGGWYAAVREPLLLVPLAVTVLASVGLVIREPAQAWEPIEQLRRVLVWHGMVLAALAASWAWYFHFVTLRVAPSDDLHRLILTAAWMLAGVFLVVLARWRELPAARDAGFAFLAAGVGKLVLYDTAHLYGLVRVGGLAAGGAVLLLGAWLTMRLMPRTSSPAVRS